MCVQQSIASSELRRCLNELRRLANEAESVSSRTGHMMAMTALQPLDERLRVLVRHAEEADVVVDGQPSSDSSTTDRTVSGRSNITNARRIVRCGAELDMILDNFTKKDNYFLTKP